MAYGNGLKAKETHRRAVEIGRLGVVACPEAARLRVLALILAEEMAKAAWPAAPLTTVLDKKMVDAVLLRVQTSGISPLNSVWREKVRLGVLDAIVDQSKRLRRCAYGKVLNAAATMVVVDKVKGKKVTSTIFCNVPRDIGVEPTALKAALKGLEKIGGAARFDEAVRLVAEADGPGVSPDQRIVLAVMRKSLLERWGRPSWDKPYSSLRLNLDPRCVGGDASILAGGLAGLNNALLTGECYSGALPLSGVQPKGQKIVLPLRFDRGRVGTLAFGPQAPKPPRPVKGGKTVPANDNPEPAVAYHGPMRFTALAVEIGGDQVVVKAVVSMPKATTGKTRFKRLIGRDYGYANTVTISVLEFAEEVDVAAAAKFKDMAREDVLERLSTHVAPPGMTVLETIRMSGKNFLDRIEAQARRVDALRSNIDTLFNRIKRLKDRIGAALGLAPTEQVPGVLDATVKDYVHVWHRKMFVLLAAAKRLKAQRIAVYRSVDGLKKAWFGFLANMETRLALAYGAGHVREDLSVMAMEKTHPKYRGRTFNRMINNGAKGQYIQRAEDKFAWHGVTAVSVPSRFTSTTDHRYAVVDAGQRPNGGDAFIAKVDGLKDHADDHASVTIGCWLALVPITEEQRQFRDAALASGPATDPKDSDKHSTGPKRHAA